MSSRRTAERPDVLHLDDPEALRCSITGCLYEGVNLVRKTRPVEGAPYPEQLSVARCRAHTSKYDHIIVGPGAL